jgi:hypothetical protein
MAGHPDITRQNAQLSTGPRSQEGKAIASRNNTQHGLLAKAPPLLGTEDYTTLEGVLTGLVEEYQPHGPLEHHLVQQIAMCILRQHRAWKAEAVAGDKAQAQETLTTHYPRSSRYEAVIPGYDGRADTHPDILQDERRALAALLDTLEVVWDGSPAKKAALTRWCKKLDPHLGKTNWAYASGAIVQAVEEAAKKYPDQCRPRRHDYTHPLWRAAGLTSWCDEVDSAWWLRQQSQEVAQVVAARIAAIDATLQEIATLEARASRAHAICEELDLIGRYETRNNRQLNQAIAQLQELQERRLATIGGITSSGKVRRLERA